MYVCVYIHVCHENAGQNYLYMCVCIHTCATTTQDKITYICVCVYTRVPRERRTKVLIYVCVYIHVCHENAGQNYLYMCVCVYIHVCHENAGQNHNIKIANVSFERVEQLKYLGTILKNENSLQEEIKSTMKSGCSCCHSVQNLCLPVCYPDMYTN